jgi:hypothetical protein
VVLIQQRACQQNKRHGFEFIGGELMPIFKTNIRTAPFKMIAGHDTTAGFINFLSLKETHYLMRTLSVRAGSGNGRSSS